MTESLLKEDTFNSQQELIVTPTKLRKARENADDRIVIGLSFSVDWWRVWRDFSGLRITAQSEA